MSDVPTGEPPEGVNPAASGPATLSYEIPPTTVVTVVCFTGLPMPVMRYQRLEQTKAEIEAAEEGIWSYVHVDTVTGHQLENRFDMSKLEILAMWEVVQSVPQLPGQPGM